MMNFNKWVVRASQAGLIMTGSFGISDSQQDKIKYLEDKLATGKSLTALQEVEYNTLLFKRENPELSKTTTSELRKIYRQEKYGRRFLFTNKYLEKGTNEEESSITLLSRHLDIPLFKNKERRTSDLFTGEPDITPDKRISKGYDVKSSWSLSTFPWADDPLDNTYEWQAQVYMNLWECDSWVISFCLVNCTERQLYSEKMKYFYQLGMPETDDPIYKSIVCEVEKNMIVDIDRFQRDFPGYDWENEVLDFDIPEKDRVVSFEVSYNEEKIRELKQRVIASRKYLNSL